MALQDLLWACPECGEDRGLWNDSATCSACGVRFERARGSDIRARYPDGREVVRSAREWFDQLPDPASLIGGEADTAPGAPGGAGDVAAGGADGDRQPAAGLVRSARVTVRPVTDERTVYGEAGYLNRVEIFGDPTPGTLRLERDRVVVVREGEGAESWPLETLTAVQASSSSLQLKAKGRPLTAFRFERDSVYLWEKLLHAVLRDFYGRTGRGAIAEFQPRISVL